MDCRDEENIKGEGKDSSHRQSDKHWHERGYLPHYDSAGIYQLITYRLADSLPKEVLVRLGLGAPHSDLPRHSVAKADATLCAEAICLGAPAASRPNSQDEASENRKRIEEVLDSGLGACVLREPQIAAMLVENWQHFDRQRYDLIAYVVMPNHVHVLIKTYSECPLSKIVHGWKSYTSNRINEFLRRKEEPAGSRRSQKNPKEDLPAGSRRSQVLWQREYWDRFIRDEKHFYNAVEYIHRNPVAAKLCAVPEAWEWSSAKTTRINNQQEELPAGSQRSQQNQGGDLPTSSQRSQVNIKS